MAAPFPSIINALHSEDNRKTIKIRGVIAALDAPVFRVSRLDFSRRANRLSRIFFFFFSNYPPLFVNVFTAVADADILRISRNCETEARNYARSTKEIQISPEQGIKLNFSNDLQSKLTITFQLYLLIINWLNSFSYRVHFWLQWRAMYRMFQIWTLVQTLLTVSGSEKYYVHHELTRLRFQRWLSRCMQFFCIYVAWNVRLG